MRPRSALHAAQVEIIEEMLSRNEAMIWLGLGGGKTAIALTVLADLGVPAIVVGTRRIVEMTWPAEIMEWEHLHHLSYRAATGTPKQRRKALEARPMVLGINYESLDWLLHEDLSFYPTIIFDEVSKMKSHSTQRYKAFMRARSHFTRIYGLTATPASESYLGLYAQFRTVVSDPILGRTVTQFRDNYTTQHFKGMYSEYVVSERNRREIEAAIAPHTLIGQAPHRDTPTILDVLVEWNSTREKEAYRVAAKQFIVEATEGFVSLASSSEAFMKTRQLATGLLLLDVGPKFTDSAKFDAIEEAFEELGGEPVLIFYQFIAEQDELLRRIPHSDILTSRTLEAFNASKIPALIVHPRSCGYGLNLQGPCRHVFWSSLPTSGEEYFQANGRVDRQGQTGQVVIKRFLRTGTVDEQLAALVDGKISGMLDLIERMRGTV